MLISKKTKYLGQCTFLPSSVVVNLGLWKFIMTAPTENIKRILRISYACTRICREEVDLVAECRKAPESFDLD